MNDKHNAPFSLLIKPASGICNIDCAYCFYSSSYNFLLKSTASPRMTKSTLSNLIMCYLDTYQKEYIFAWQGGEPTLMGLEFYNYSIQLEMQYAKYGSTIGNAIQTNGILISQEWAKFLSRNKFLVGISLDGPLGIHDQYRKFKNGTGTFSYVMKAIELFKKYEVAFNALVLVTKANVQKPKTVFHFLTDQGILYHQYIPAIGMLIQDRPVKQQSPFVIESEEWGYFLCGIFDEWLKYGIGNVSIRLFDSIINYMVYGKHVQCINDKVCNHYFLVEYNGDVFPCDFFVSSGSLIGNIFENSWKEMIQSNKYQKFISIKSLLHRECVICPYVEFCNGDCPVYRYPKISSKWNLSRLCNGWKIFYNHALPRIKKVSESILSTECGTNRFVSP